MHTYTCNSHPEIIVYIFFGAMCVIIHHMCMSTHRAQKTTHLLKHQIPGYSISFDEFLWIYRDLLKRVAKKRSESIKSVAIHCVHSLRRLCLLRSVKPNQWFEHYLHFLFYITASRAHTCCLLSYNLLLSSIESDLFPHTHHTRNFSNVCWIFITFHWINIHAPRIEV